MVQNQCKSKIRAERRRRAGPCTPALSPRSSGFAGHRGTGCAQVTPKTRHGATGALSVTDKSRAQEGRSGSGGEERVEKFNDDTRLGVWLTEFLSPRYQKMRAVPRAGGPKAPDSSQVQGGCPQHGGENILVGLGVPPEVPLWPAPAVPTPAATVLLCPLDLGCLTQTVHDCFWGL